MYLSRRLLPRSCHAAWLLLIFALSAGCPGKKPSTENATPGKQPPLALLVVDDPQLGEAVGREWRARTEQELITRPVSASEIEKASRLPGDVIIFPSGIIGSLAERGLIAPLDSASLESTEFNYRDIFDQIRLREMKWGAKTLAAPLGSPQLLLAYRADIFQKAQISPPQTWADYQRAIEKLNDPAVLGELALSADQTWHAAVEPLAEGWAGQLLLARAAAYAMHRDQVSPLFRFDSMSALVDQPPYKRALQELMAAAKQSPFARERLTPQEALLELRAGRCAMALTWPNTVIDGSERRPADEQIRFAMLPGAAEAYRFATKSWENRRADESFHVPLLAMTGRMTAISATSADPRRTESFVLWLGGSEVGQQVAPHSAATTLFRQSQAATSSRWTGSLPAEASRQYADVLSQTLSLPRSFPGLTIPGRERYLKALDEAVQQAMEGTPVAAALQEAGKQWDEITSELGLDKQRQANARSLGQATP